MASLVPWKADSPEALLQALQHLRAGRLVGFPSDSVYHVAACALLPDAVRRLQAACPESRPTLALGFPMEVFDWLPHLRGPALRIARRFWPGACTLVAGHGLEQGLASRLLPDVRQLLCPDGLIALTVPNHLALRQAAYHLAVPLVVCTPSLAVKSAEEMQRAVGEQAALILDGGRASDPRPPTSVVVEGRNAMVEREGAVPASEIEDALPCRIVFLCTGNTCRSPMAQALCKKMLCDWLGCAPEALPRRGYIVQSAGLAALEGEQASPEGAEVVRGLGGDLQGHRSQPLNYDLLAHADFLFAMTRSHLRLLADVQGQAGPRPRLLSGDGQDIADPIGGPPEIYAECARQIRACLEKILPELQENG